MLRGCLLKRITTDGASPGLRMFKIVDDTLQPADPAADVDAIVAWLEQHGYVERGALAGEQDLDEEPVVLWLKPGDEPEYLAEVLGWPIAPATVCYARGEKRFVTTRTRCQIRQSRRRDPDGCRDLAYVRLPTKAALAHAYGLA